MRSAARVWVVGFTLVTAAGCVTQDKYDVVVERLNTIRKDLNIAKAEELALSQEVKARESLQREAQSDATAASAALQRAKDEAEAQRRMAEGRLATLQRAVSQLVAEQLTLRDKLEGAMSDSLALQDIVAVYRRKMRTESGTGAPAQPPQIALAPAPASPIPAASSEAGSTPAETGPQLPLPVRPLPEKPPAQKDQPAGPQEESLLSAITEWLIHLWQSLVSLWQSLVP